MIHETKKNSLMSMAQLLQNKSIQYELELTCAQYDDLSAAFDRIRREPTGDADEALSGILTQEQHKRFREIRSQVQALRSFGDAEVQSQLQLTDDQRGQIREVLRDGFEKTSAIRNSPEMNLQKAYRNISVLRKETIDKTVAVLTGKQKSHWEQMRGEHSEVKQASDLPVRQDGPGMAGGAGMRGQRRGGPGVGGAAGMRGQRQGGPGMGGAAGMRGRS